MSDEPRTVIYLGESFTRSALQVWLPDAQHVNILPLPEDEAACEFLRGQGELVLVPRTDRDRTIRSTLALLKAAGLPATISPVSAEWFTELYLPKGRLESLLQGAPRDVGGHVVLALDEFFAQSIPDQAQLLGPIHEADVGFLAAWRGTGKTLFNLSVSVAVAGGLPFLGWDAGPPRPVLYVDGEMPFALLRAHLSTVIDTFRESTPKGREFDPAMLRILTPDVQPDGLEPDLSTKAGRARMDACIGDSALVILDNLSALVGGDAENDSEAFEPIRRYQKSLRRRGIASILVHHAGKGGDQRGHSGKEDLVDFSAILEPPAERVEATGARFRLKWKKVRRDLPFLRDLDVSLLRGSGSDPARWEHQTIGEAVEEIVHRLSDEGHTQKEIVSILREDHQIRKSIRTVNAILRGNK